MPTASTTRTVDDDGLDQLRRPRTDLLTERSAGPDAWTMDEGPFRHYRRTLQVSPTAAGRHRVTERIEFSLAVPLWKVLINPLMKRALRSADRRTRRRWWWPAQLVDQRTATMVGVLSTIGVVTGYLGVMIGQTITFAAADFGRGDAAQANTLAAVRIGVLLPVLLLPRADRLGRRPLILAFATTAIAFTVVGAAAPDLEILGLTQTVARGLTTGLITLLVVASTEEVPSGARAFTISILTMATALGAGMVLWVLPVADVVDGGWRIVYAAAAVFLPLVWWVGRQLPETRRFAAATTHEAPGRIEWGRFVLLGTTAFVSAMFFSPASQLRNEFLRDDLGYTAASVSLFQLIISAPAGTAILVSGILADRIGRRRIASISLAVGGTMLALSYQLTGPGLWLTASVGVVLTGAAIPATRGYSSELFPTRSRARVGGLLDGVGVAGSAAGLVLVGQLSERWDDLGRAIGLMVVAPLVVAAIIAIRFPETASTELEAFNPDDPVMPGPGGGRSEPVTGPGSGASRPRRP
ncbi:MAG: MFS transporter [Acidimicrobiales bacterium]